MKLQKIFDHLSVGELSQLNFGAQGPGIINDVNMDTILSHINLGLADLFSRFDLKQSMLTVALQPGQSTYPLTSLHSTYGRGSVAPKYILDEVISPFKDDVLLIQRVKTDLDYELPLNRMDTIYSCMTSGMDTLQVPLSIVDKSLALPKEIVTDNLRVFYRANHPVLDPNIGSFDPERLNIELPFSHLTALLYFIGSRASNPVGLGQEFNAGNTYAAKYENECARLKNDGMEIQQRGEDSKFRARGFV